MAKYSLGDVIFKTKGEARTHISALLKSYTLGERVKEHALISALFDRHPEVDSKRGAGVDYFYVDRDPWGGKCFYVMRIDGTHTDFGTKHCFDGESRTKYTGAFRKVILLQILDFKQGREGDVDHDPPFIHLLEDWAKENGVVLGNHLLRPSRDNKFCEELLDEELGKSFSEYHKKHAGLFMLSAKENRRKGWLAQRNRRYRQENGDE
jgi:hypothetical protein